MRVLLVDDSPAMRAFIRRVLALSGVPVTECFEAADGVDALERLAGNTADLILCDINMPRMNGEQFIEVMHSRGLLENSAVLFISTDSTSTRMQRMLALGARGYLRKPFTPEALRTAVEDIFPDLVMAR